MPPTEPSTGPVRERADDRIRKSVEEEAGGDGETCENRVQAENLVVVQHGVRADRGQHDRVPHGSDAEEKLGAQGQLLGRAGLGAGHEITPWKWTAPRCIAGASVKLEIVTGSGNKSGP